MNSGEPEEAIFAPEESLAMIDAAARAEPSKRARRYSTFLCARVSQSGVEQAVVVRNISTSGVYVETSARLARGNAVTFSRGIVAIVGKITRTDAKGSAIAFENAVSPETLESLRRRSG